MISITVNSESARARLEQVLSMARNPAAALKVAGRQVANDLRAHFRERDRLNPNKLGGKRTHFWLQVMRSVQAPVVKSPQLVTVSINHPHIAQKVFGGDIHAKRVRFLTIPVAAAAHGRTAKTLAYELGIKLFVVGDGDRGVLASKAADGGLQVWYVLRRSVRQEPDADALPSMEKLSDAAVEKAEAVVRRQLQGPPPRTVG